MIPVMYIFISLSWLTKSWNLFSRKKIISKMCWSLMKNFFSLFFTQRSENYESVYGKLKQQLSVCVTFHSFSLLHFFTSSHMHVYRVLFLAKLYVFKKCFLFSLFVPINTFHLLFFPSLLSSRYFSPIIKRI